MLSSLNIGSHALELSHENKFGQKLLEKMGWSSGKGLGKTGQGNIEPITVTHKDDTKGVGFEGHDDTWIAHQDDFAAVLANLNQHHGTADKDEGNDNNSDGEKKKKKSMKSKKKKKNKSASGSDGEAVSDGEEAANDEEREEVNNAASLEQLSKKMRKRVHYHKFTRGKDVSRMSGHDLACILGTQAVKQKRKAEAEEIKSSSEEESSSESEAEDKKESENNDGNGSDVECFARVGFSMSAATDNNDEDKKSKKKGKKSHGFVTIKSGSTTDYFAKKLAVMEAKRKEAAKNAPPVEILLSLPQRSPVREQEEVEEVKSEPEEESTGNNINDYFAKKMAAKLAKKEAETAVPVEEKEEEESPPSTASNMNDYFAKKMAAKLAKKEAEVVEEVVPEEEEEEEKPKKSKKKSKKDKKEPVEDVIVEEAEPVVEEVKREKLSKKERKQRKMEAEAAALQAEEQAKEEKAAKKKRKREGKEDTGEPAAKKVMAPVTFFKGANVKAVEGYAKDAPMQDAAVVAKTKKADAKKKADAAKKGKKKKKKKGGKKK